MQPQQPYQQPQPTGGNYDFFLNPEKPPKPPPLSRLGGSNSKAIRAVIVTVLAFVVLIVLYVIFSLFSGGSTNTTALTAVAQDQNELVRVANEGTTQAVNQTAMNFAQSAALSLTTDQQQLLKFLTAHRVKLSTKTLAATKNISTDQQLTAATQASDFDTVFLGIMKTQLTSYQSALKSAYNSSSSTNEKQLLTNEYNNAELLLKELTSPNQ